MHHIPDLISDFNTKADDVTINVAGAAIIGVKLKQDHEILALWGS